MSRAGVQGAEPRPRWGAQSLGLQALCSAPQAGLRERVQSRPPQSAGPGPPASSRPRLSAPTPRRGLAGRPGGPGNPARRRRRHWCVTGAPAPGLRALRPPLGPAARPRALLRAPAARPRAPRLAPLSTGGARSPGAGGREMRGKGRVSGPWSSRASGT